MIRYYTSFFVWVIMFICVSAMLYSTSTEVALLKTKTNKLNKEIAAEETSLHILKAEWAYLTNPIRIEQQAKKRLNMSVIAANRIVSIVDMNKNSESSKQTDTVTFVSKKPVASVEQKPVSKTYAENKPSGLDKFNHGRINDKVRFEAAISIQ